jgi:hypothetical protein
MGKMAYSGVVADFPVANPVLKIQEIGQILIFSLLKIRKKTAGIIAGITIAALSLWGVSIWQNISPSELLNILLSTLVMLATIIFGAFLLIAALKILLKWWRKNNSITPLEED